MEQKPVTVDEKDDDEPGKPKRQRQRIRQALVCDVDGGQKKHEYYKGNAENWESQ